MNSKIFTLQEKPFQKQITLFYTDKKPVANIIYIHGGGLIYGNRDDLPKYHLEKLLNHSYNIISVDYPLAPEKKLDYIIKDLADTINLLTSKKISIPNINLPYFLWGRSAGAYLSLLLIAKNMLNVKPNAILSYYGYGFFKNDWNKMPSKYYNQFPKIKNIDYKSNDHIFNTSASLESKYDIYVYARQTGLWNDIIYSGREKYFYSDYSLRNISKLPVPLFITQAINDTDIPFDEFLTLSNKFNPTKFIAPLSVHDFDRDTDNLFTMKLIDKTIKFLNSNI